MLARKDAADTAFQRTHLHAFLAGHADDVDIVAALVELGCHRERHHDRLGSTAVDADVAARIVHADNPQEYRAHLDVAAARVVAFREKIVVNPFADDADLALLLHVRIADGAAVFEQRCLYFMIVAGNTLDGNRRGVPFIRGRLTPVAHLRCHYVEFGHQRAEPFDILAVELPVTAFLHSLPGLGSIRGDDDDRIGGESLEIHREHLLESVSAADQEQEHEQAPEDTEAGQQRAALVAEQRIPDLAESIYVQTVSHLIQPSMLQWV